MNKHLNECTEHIITVVKYPTFLSTAANSYNMCAIANSAI